MVQRTLAQGLFISTKTSMKRKESHVRCHLLCLYHGLLRVKGDKEHETQENFRISKIQLTLSHHSLHTPPLEDSHTLGHVLGSVKSGPSLWTLYSRACKGHCVETQPEMIKNKPRCHGKLSLGNAAYYTPFSSPIYIFTT